MLIGMDYRVALGVIATVMALVSYVPYIRDMVSGRTKPHAFTWLVWATLTAIAFAGQTADNAGPGSWVTGFTALVSFGIFAVALRHGEKEIVPLDWISLAAAGLGLVLWALTDQPLLAVVLITVIDALGFVPTFRKSYSRPFEETAVTYAISGLKFVVAILALENLSLVTWLYPASLVLMNGLFVGMVLTRRRQLSAPKTA